MAQATRALTGRGDGTSPAGDRRAALVVAAEAALAHGDAVAAFEGFEQAGTMQHAADSEMGLVRAAMQLGHYRRALAFCAHVAGEHLDAPGAAVLYAWLLRVGGRRELADRALREALARAPDDPVVIAAIAALASPLPVAPLALLRPPNRVAPFSSSVVGEQSPPPEARVLSSGVLLPGGRLALLSGRVRPSRLWVRNGLGATREAVNDDDGDAEGDATRWRLTTPIDGSDDIDVGRPVPGTPAFGVEYAETSTPIPAWPWMRAGFLGAATADGKTFRLGTDMAAAHAGGPVLDRAGGLVGMALRGADGRATMRAVALRGTLADGEDLENGARSRAKGPTIELPFDQLYERALRVAIQVIAVA